MERKKCSKEKADLLDKLVDELDIDDVVYLLAELMKKNGDHGLITRRYDEIGGQKMVSFRMRAEQDYYLDDDDEWDVFE